MKNTIYLFICFLWITACNNTKQQAPTEDVELTASTIMQRAHEKAGGEFWSQPKSLSLFGYGVFYENGEAIKHEKHNMWRVFESKKDAAHIANGKVRIESFRSGKPFFLITYDGENTYDLNGKQEKSAADQRWASNFGYGVIRHAFDEGYRLEKAGVDTINNEMTHQIKIIDPQGGETLFDITQKDYKIVRVGFDTPRGWHERIYSNFFTKDEYNWFQAGKVELFYKGKKANDIIWTDFEVNESLADSLFVLI